VRLRELCDERDMLLILDEAQTGFGRLGRDFAFQGLGIVPDILSLSKTLGGGLPLAATVTGNAIEADCREKGFLFYTSHISDPMPAEVGLAVLAVLRRENLAERAAQMGAYLREGLEGLQARHEIIGDIRGRGLLMGVELVEDRTTRAPNRDATASAARQALENGLILNVLGAGSANTLRLAPPLTVSRDEIDSGLAILDEALAKA
jgi:2,2-dialkylglycine decarboxylase (pyruvate)